MSPSTAPDDRSGLRFSPWNLLLLLPFLMLVTPWFNRADPRLFGMPFFYWVQFVWVVVGVLSVGVVHLLTCVEPGPTAPGDPADVDELDEGVPR